MIIADVNKLWEKDLSSLLIQKFGREQFQPGLERIQAALGPELFKYLNNLDIITIAGTNGKGQTAFAIASYFEELNLEYCLWTSPHLVSFRERFRKKGEFISESKLDEILEKALEKVESSKLKLSYYEFCFFVFCLWAYDLRTQVLILEVGLGGRFDAVNVFDAKIVGLTSISRDHTEFLGNSFKEILYEKIAVTRASGELISTLELDYLRLETSKYCSDKKVQWRDLFLEERISKNESYIERNSYLAFEIVKSLLKKKNIPFERTGPASFSSTMGRDQVMTIEGRTLIFIGAHNIDGVRNFINRVKTRSDNLLCEIDFLWIAFSERKEQEILTMIGMLSKLEGMSSYLTDFDHPRAWTVKGDDLIGYRKNWKSWLKGNESKNKKTLFFGSYFFLGEVQKSIHK